ncbi:MAG TPA: lipocalin-like domain-containing protein [Xanthobacteraceae bacterium]|nr:lipocalin-like domain-containing protein [Xanthobacteraceae bacterium]
MRLLPLCFIAIILLGRSATADENEKLFGVWKLVSLTYEDAQTGELKQFFGQHPKGYLILLSNGRMSAIVTAEGRTAPGSDEERGAAFRSMVAYSGTYRIEGDKWITKVDVAWNEAWVGTEQVRTYKLVGDRLDVTAMTQPAVNFSGRVLKAILSWEREK